MHAAFGTDDGYGRARGCCFWSSPCCDYLKIGALSIIEGLAIAAIASSIVLFLAQKGYAPVEIQNLAGLIEAQWLIVGMEVSVGIAIINSCAVFALGQLFLNQKYLGDLSQKDPKAEYYELEMKRLSEDGELLSLLSIHRNRMCNNEYFVETMKNGHFVVLIKNHEGKFQYHFYETKKEKNSFIRNSSYHSTLRRQNIECDTFVGSVMAFIDHQNLVGPFYRVFQYQDSPMALVIKCTIQVDDYEYQFINKKKLKKEIATLKGHQEIKEEFWQTLPLEEREKVFLKERAFDVTIEFWSEQLNKRSEECFVVREHGPYAVLIIKNQEGVHIDFYKNVDPALRERIKGPLAEYKRF